MLVDMAGSENIEQAGQSGFEAKMQVTCLSWLILILESCRLSMLIFYC